MMVISLNNDLTVINDISETLKMLVENNISELPPNSVVFDSPADIQKSNKSGLSLFLYQISENPDLKNQDMQSHDSKIQYPPMVIDLHYLLTPYAQTRPTEQIIISKLLRAFHDNSIIAGTSLKSSLKETDNAELRLVYHPIPLEQLNNLWGTFHETSYKLSLSYLVTPVRIPSDRVLETTRVISKESSFTTK